MLGLIYLIVGLVFAGIYCLVCLPISVREEKNMIIRESFLMGMFWPLTLIVLIVSIFKL